MAIEFDATDCRNHVVQLTAYVKTLVDISYESVTADNVDAFRAAARSLGEPHASRIFNILNFITFNTQVTNVYYGDNNG